MMKKGDFIEIEYTGTVKDLNYVFDTTDKEIAKKEEIQGNQEYGPITICLGQGQLIEGLDLELVGKEPGKEYDFNILPEHGFGKKDAKLIQLIPTSKFKKEKISPMPGMQINIDGLPGLVKTVSGGRTVVDFNHPLSGRELHYHVKVNKIVTDTKEKLTAYISLSMGQKKSDIAIDIHENIAEIKIKTKIPDEIKNVLSDKIMAVVPEIKEIKLNE